MTEKKIQNIEIKTDSTELKTEKAEKQYENIKLNSFLENPIDLQEFKKTKNRNVTTTINNGLDYQYHPKINDSIFYGYNFITENIGEKGRHPLNSRSIPARFPLLPVLVCHSRPSVGYIGGCVLFGDCGV